MPIYGALNTSFDIGLRKWDRSPHRIDLMQSRFQLFIFRQIEYIRLFIFIRCALVYRFPLGTRYKHTSGTRVITHTICIDIYRVYTQIRLPRTLFVQYERRQRYQTQIVIIIRDTFMPKHCLCSDFTCKMGKIRRFLAATDLVQFSFSLRDYFAFLSI